MHRLHSRHPLAVLLRGAQMAGPAGPAMVTSYIKQAWTVDALFHTCSTHGSGFNHIHLSACWNKLGHLARDAGQQWFQEYAGALESLVQHTICTISTSTEIRARELANIAHGVAKSGRGGALSALMEALARSIVSRAGDCNTQELANVAWAFAKAGQPDTELFAALAREAERHLGAFNAQELANTAWAFATIGHPDAQLFAALARVAEQRLGDFSPQGLANTAWAFATAGHLDATLFGAVAKMARQRLDGFNAQDLAHTAWAFAKLGQFDAELFTAVARSTERHLESFNAQGLANTVWAFAKAGQLDAQLFAALAQSIERRSMLNRRFLAPQLATPAWLARVLATLDTSPTRGCGVAVRPGRSRRFCGFLNTQAALGRLQLSGPCQHRVGLCKGVPRGRSVLWRVGEVVGALPGRVQRARPGEHSVGVCQGRPDGRAAVHGSRTAVRGGAVLG